LIHLVLSAAAKKVQSWKSPWRSERCWRFRV